MSSARTRENAFVSNSNRGKSSIMIGEIVKFDDLRKLSRLDERAKIASIERWAKRVAFVTSTTGAGQRSACVRRYCTTIQPWPTYCDPPGATLYAS